jgi:hypothetical protein
MSEAFSALTVQMRFLPVASLAKRASSTEPISASFGHTAKPQSKLQTSCKATSVDLIALAALHREIQQSIGRLVFNRPKAQAAFAISYDAALFHWRALPSMPASFSKPSSASLKVG